MGRGNRPGPFRAPRVLPPAPDSYQFDIDFRSFLPQCHAFVEGKFSPLRAPKPTGQNRKSVNRRPCYSLNAYKGLLHGGCIAA